MQGRKRIRDRQCRKNQRNPHDHGGYGLEVVSMKDAGIKADIEENGKTYEENALIKARAVVAAFTKDIVMADDSDWRLMP